MPDSFEERLAREREKAAARRRESEDAAARHAIWLSAAKMEALGLVDEVKKAALVLAASPIPPRILEHAKRVVYGDDGLATVRLSPYAVGYLFRRHLFGRVEFIAFQHRDVHTSVLITPTGDVRVRTLDQKLSLPELIERQIVTAQLLSQTLDVIVATLTASSHD